MKKLVVAGMLGLAACTGLSGTAVSGPLFGAGGSFGTINSQQQPPVIRVQANEAYRVQQLEEQIRQLNGRIEEMSFQLLQMQETIRKAQEDNEFRFQELESGKAASPTAAPKKKAEASPVNPATPPTDDVATIIETPPEGGASISPPASSTGAPGETTLGSIELDSKGMPVGGTLNQNANNSSGNLPGVATGNTAARKTDPVNTAALTSEGDIYQAAYGHVLSGDYKLAEQGFQQYLQGYPKGTKAADASFWLGEAQYSQGKFNEAAKTFLNGHQAYGKSPKAPEMLMKLGMSLAALDNTETACATLREVPKRYPNASKTVLSKVASEQKRLSC
ncbi:MULTISPECIES: tol-pal system protein YbgF [unclassified Agrobacterium]|uniref:tol-pal system protein YbgF n=1 Tax=unclassified Agrobacterium TaxID=2632611 RepID=UPI002449528F|nr:MULTISPECIES: tol-pal system protein YbgF [unclassified Agrobacterium]MDH0612082.1 tol-pal system protein YbgF [Agrobacterium sp. GD03872]MDH0695979.1 tol-pal system protein YbgF [Agrobacterium sp. GD03871]MDH1058747.1 tol-pal system protein YbgF [Agrobacterium sp. GD03992]MDH2210838.1 tol-pal system protein YbgF [Agrobacterium sp. GD03643]MDH2217745.1 tol-pal system protein YbgF [Agrobacterium sp. GD03638]